MITSSRKNELLTLPSFGLWHMYSCYGCLLFLLVSLVANVLKLWLENGVMLMYTLEGVSSVANFITAHEESK